MLASAVKSATRRVAPVAARAASSSAGTAAAAGASAASHPWLDYKHPGAPGSRGNDYRDPSTDFGFHLSGAFFERPHIRRYTDHLQGDGKLFKATSELLPAEQTIPTFYVPNAASFSVADGAKVDVNEVLAKHDDVTCLTVSFSGLGLPNQDLSQWQSKFLADFGSKPGYRLVNLKYMDGFEYYFAPGFFTNMVKGALAPEVQEHSIAVFEPYHYNITWFTELAAMHNRSYGFVYLINKQGEVVWRAHGLPEDGELTAMSDAASKLA